MKAASVLFGCVSAAGSAQEDEVCEDSWNFEKNIKTDEMKAIIRIRKRRQDDEDKDTQFRLGQRPVP